MTRPAMAFFGSSLVSAYWNGAATYYRGIIRALGGRGWDVTFFEPDAYERQAHRDMPDPPWARVVVYDATPGGLVGALDAARGADVLVKASGVGVFDEDLEREVPAMRRRGQTCLYWDVDAPATLDRLQADPADPLRAVLPAYDMVLTYGGGARVREVYLALGARACEPIYNAVDADTHHRVAPEAALAGDLALLANRLPDREARIREFFFEPAGRLPDRRFLLAGAGWTPGETPPNVRVLGHLPTDRHNAFNCSSLAVLNVNRASMARYGHSPATRVFEAAGAGACLVSDAWAGLDRFLEPDREVLVAHDGAMVADHVATLTPARARRIGAAARERVLAEHTYAHRVDRLEQLLAVPLAR